MPKKTPGGDVGVGDSLPFSLCRAWTELAHPTLNVVYELNPSLLLQLSLLIFWMQKGRARLWRKKRFSVILIYTVTYECSYSSNDQLINACLVTTVLGQSFQGEGRCPVRMFTTQHWIYYWPHRTKCHEIVGEITEWFSWDKRKLYTQSCETLILYFVTHAFNHLQLGSLWRRLSCSWALCDEGSLAVGLFVVKALDLGTVLWIESLSTPGYRSGPSRPVAMLIASDVVIARRD